MNLLDASVEALGEALRAGTVTSVGLTSEYLRRVARFDRSGPRLNAVPVLNPAVFEEARASDERRARGESLGPLDGIPYTVKDSYLTRGLPTAAGSPAFAEVRAQQDAFAVERLRAAGAVLIGHTNMCPLANGGMQRGLYGRSESPYNPGYLPAGYVSGSSHGSGVATTTAMAAFGLGEETWSSGRSPASNNSVCAYTPSRGLISIRGNWPLTPTMDVVVPHTRTIADLRAVLDALMVEDPQERGDFWRSQPWIPLPGPASVRPAHWGDLDRPDALEGRRVGIPGLYLSSGTEGGLPLEAHPDIVELWERARAVLAECGAEVVEVAFPLVERYGFDPADATSLVGRGLVPPGFLREEVHDLTAWALDDFLRMNGDPRCGALADADGEQLFPVPPGTLPDSLAAYGPEYDFDLAEYVALARRGVPHFTELPSIGEGIAGLEAARREDFEEWMLREELDLVVFPAAADVGREDTERDPESYAHGWRAGVGVSTGGLAIRHYGIPTVTVPMGAMRTTGMPVGLTFAGPAYSDGDLIASAGAFEHCMGGRVEPPRTPPLPPPRVPAPMVEPGRPAPRLRMVATRVDEEGAVRVEVHTDADLLELLVDGETVAESEATGAPIWCASHTLPGSRDRASPTGRIVQVLAAAHDGRGSTGAFAVL